MLHCEHKVDVCDEDLKMTNKNNEPLLVLVEIHCSRYRSLTDHHPLKSHVKV